VARTSEGKRNFDKRGGTIGRKKEPQNMEKHNWKARKGLKKDCTRKKRALPEKKGKGSPSGGERSGKGEKSYEGRGRQNRKG